MAHLTIISGEQEGLGTDDDPWTPVPTTQNMDPAPASMKPLGAHLKCKISGPPQTCSVTKHILTRSAGDSPVQ